MKLAGAVLALSLIVTAAAWAKEIPPGGLFICGSRHCRVVNEAATRAFSSLLWGPGLVYRAPTPPVGSPIFQLRLRDGPAGVIVNATSFRVHGLYCGRFRRGRWYRLPRALRGLSTGLEPKRLRAPVPHSC
jgi:hypothetical protein